METSNFEPTVSQLKAIFTKTENCHCPSGRVRWIGLPCANNITGIVYDAHTGDPIAGVNVWAESFSTGDAGESETDDLGRFEIGSLKPAEDYYLSVGGARYSHRLLEDITLPEQGSLGSIALLRSGSIEGTVRNIQGHPIKDARVYASQQNTSFGSEEMTVNNDKGKFCFCDLNSSLALDGGPAMPYRVIAVHPNYSFLEDVCYVPPHYTRGDEVIFEGVMKDKVFIEGSVYVGDNPSSDAIVYVLNELIISSTNERSFTTDSLGKFSFKVDAPADYDLVVSPSDAFPITQSISVNPGSSLLVPRIQLPGAGSVQGVITDLAGLPVKNALVQLFTSTDSDVPWNSVLSSDDGIYSSGDVPPFDMMSLELRCLE